ncbi:MFS general substrate transporter [Linderina pennispora]|uniref:MFS general substrate transporter n=1 Tax=Linderina pennispora TaxID=61395 RepID=A0A1Y1VWJ3_9FUNG|nr:MFS general substrate transporter [Linderina pennispora]ORX65667.1 MFS general substrate transporter [Linderina pennispora]
MSAPPAQATAQQLQQNLGKRISRIVFIALLLDILSFTIILPLLPRSLEAYKSREGADATTLLGSILQHVSSLRQQILSLAGPRASRFLLQGSRADLVLLGGLLGSLYSLLQCLVAPVIGRASDRLGRRRTMMFCMAGNVVWTVLWIFSTGFESFLVARVIAGLSEGNVQLSHGMALVGIAFAVGFTLGPSIGAYFASLPLEAESSAFAYAPFATAAVFSLGLLVLESAYLYANLPETLDFKHSAEPKVDEGTSELPASSPGDRHVAKVLRRLNWTHFAYLFFFSGMEYTLTFLTHDKFDFSNAQQGKLLWLHRHCRASRDKALVAQGMAGCALGLLSIAICAFKAEATGYSAPSWWLWAGSFGFAVASATVVNCLNSMVSLAGSQGMAPKDTGKRLGDFRSAGQIGRALGPMFACSVYWLSGAAVCYLIGAIAVAAITTVFVSTIP